MAEWPGMRTARLHGLGAAAICVLLAVGHTWPLAADPARHSRMDSADGQLNAWILAWVAHQLPRDPLHLFDANIFHPARDVLAFSEPLILPGALGAPVAWSGGSPVLVYNLVVMAGLALTALAAYRLMFAWTGDHAAALLTGSMFAFNSHTLTRLAHVQGLHLYGIPLALLAADRLLVHARTRDALSLAVWMAALAYTSGYLAMFGIVMIAATLASRAPEWWGPRAVAVLGRYGLASAATALLVIPVYLPYLRVAETQGMVRPIESVGEFSATLSHYLAAGGRLHHSLWSAPFFLKAQDGYFPGLVVLGLAGFGVWRGLRLPKLAGSAAAEPVHRALSGARIRMLIAIAAAGVILSLGTHTPVYGWLFEIFAPLRGMRAASRFGTLFVFAASCLAGFGLWFVRSRLCSPMRPASRTGLAIGIAVIAMANIESVAAPIVYRPYRGIPDVYGRVAAEPDPVVLVEIPLYRASQTALNAGYVLASTKHWKPVVNGYSGYVPREYEAVAETFRGFPGAAAVAAMRDAGVTHVMVHPARFAAYADAVLRQLDAHGELELLAEGADRSRLYRIKPAS